MQRPESMVTIGIRVPRTLKERLDAASHANGVSLADHLRSVLERSLTNANEQASSVPILERYPHPPPVSAQAAPFEDLWLSMTSTQSGSDEAL